MNNIQIVEPDIKDLQKSSGSMLELATALSVNDDRSFTTGGEMLIEIKRIAKTVEARFDEPVTLAFKAHRSLTALRDSVLSPFKQAETMIKRKLGDHQMLIERQRQQEAARQRAEAEAKAEAERMAKAQEQMDKGDLKACEQTLAAPLAPVVARVEMTEAPKVAGLSFKDKWFFEVTNVNEIPLEYMVPDLKAIGGVVTALGSKTNIPGIRIWSEKIVSGRTRPANDNGEAGQMVAA